MQQTSQTFENYILSDSRMFQSKLIVDGDTIIDDVRSIKLSGGSNSESDFSIGSAVSRYIEVSMPIPGISLESHEVEWQISSAEIEDVITMGTYIVGKPEADEREIKFTAFDRMSKTDKAYFSKLSTNTNTLAVLGEISDQLQIPITVTGLTSIAMKKPVGYTYREVLSYIAQLYGGFAVCDRQGNIVIKTYVDTGLSIPADRYWDSFTRNEFNYVLQKLTCYTGKDKEGNDISISTGSGIREVGFSNPFMTQAVMNAVWSELKNYTYMPGKLKFFGDPRLDPWDVVTVYGTDDKVYKVPLMKLTQEFDGGLTTEIEAVGKTEAEAATGFKGPSVQAQDRYAVELALINEAIINKLDVDTANINYAKIKDLDVINEKVQNLEGDYGDFKVLVTKDFSAVTGRIETFDSNLANILNLLSGNAGIGDLVNIHLTSENAVLDTAMVRTQIAQKISVNDLNAGRIYTNKFEIWSDENGGMQMIGATQQWTDQQGVIRMQSGLDADGEFNYYILDQDGNIMFDALRGVQAEGIKAPIIRDDMVANNAGIKGSKVLIDEKNQTLDIAFSELEYTASNASANALDAKSQVSSISSSLNDINLQISQINSEIQGIVADDGTYVLQTFVDGGSVDDEATATIHARVYMKNAEITQTIPADRFLWIRASEDAAGDEEWNSKQITGYSLTLTGEDVNMIASFTCLMTIPEEYSLITTDDDLVTDTQGNELLALLL